MHVLLVLSGKFCILMIFKKMFVSPFVFVSVGARCESTFSTGGEGGGGRVGRISSYSNYYCKGPLTSSQNG